jgi:hypothetical protein
MMALSLRVVTLVGPVLLAVALPSGLEAARQGTSGEDALVAAEAPADRRTEARAPASWWRVYGRVESIAGSTLVLTTPEGRTIAVDMSQVEPDVHKSLLPGYMIAVWGPDRGAGLMTAVGVSIDHGAPAASPGR